jgi:hypothetical protein
VASKALKGLTQNTFAPSATKKLPQLLKSSVIYGANASGKSNFMIALQFMKDMVTRSAQDAQVGEPIDDIQPFRLAQQSRDEDSEFEILFIEKEVRYQYGFALNQTRITHEWLIAYPEGKPQRWFERIYDIEKKKYTYKYSPKFDKKELHSTWEQLTIANALYLSVAIQKGNEQLTPVFSWFQQRLQQITIDTLGDTFTAKKCDADSKGKEQVLAFMNSAAICIDDISITKKPFSKHELPSDMPITLKDEIASKLNGKFFIEPKFLHKDIETSELISFDAEDESDGTRALFAFAGPWLDVLDNDLILVIDEIDTHLHPLIVHHLIRLLHSHQGKAQIIFTTHDTTLLSQRLLRPDQIWFMEKDKQQASTLYSLADFSPRENEAIEKGYLNGRYGATPFLSKLDFYGQ